DARAACSGPAAAFLCARTRLTAGLLGALPFADGRRSPLSSVLVNWRPFPLDSLVRANRSLAFNARTGLSALQSALRFDRCFHTGLASSLRGFGIVGGSSEPKKPR